MIIQLEEAKSKLLALESDVKELGDSLKIERLREQAKTLEAQTLAENFWNDQANSGKVLQELKRTKDKIEAYEKLCTSVSDALVLAEMGIEENDESVCDEVLSEVKKIEAGEEKMRIDALLSGEYDRNNAILSFHPGAGGTEAQDWALMLYRMYTRYGEKHGFNVKLIDWLDGEEAGIKSATILVEGTNAYGYLKSEHGVHRLVRVSPFDASGRRHTSFASVEVMPELDDDVNIELKDEDLEITAHRSSGAGGQHINKTSSAIRITHLPTGIVVQCQNERSQHMNKDKAMQMLKSKLLLLKQQEQAEKMSDIRGEVSDINFGNQIRSYVMQPYTMVKDHRTNAEISNVGAVMDGNIDPFINAYLSMDAEAQKGKKE